MRMGMSALVHSIIWTYLHSSNKRLWGCECAWEHKPPATQEDGNGRYQCITEQDCVSLVTTFLLPHAIDSLPLCLRSQRHHRGNHKSHIASSFSTDWGAQHTPTQTLGCLCEGGFVIKRRHWPTHTEVDKVQSSGWALWSDHMTLKPYTLTLTHYWA